MKFTKIGFTFIFLLLSIRAMSTIHYDNAMAYFSKSDPVNVDIDQDGLWDVKLSGQKNGPHYIQLSYRDASNYTAMNIVSQAEPNPVPFPQNANMNMVGVWVKSSQQGTFEIKDFMDQGVKFIGIKLIKNNIQYCAWIEIFNWSSGTLGVGDFAWDDENKAECMLAGQKSYLGIFSPFLNEISIYPSPANDLIYIKGIQTETVVNIVNSLGQIVLTTKIDSENPLDLSQLVIGIYFIFIKQNDIAFKKKFIINR